jgi:hypothetical protein
MRIFLTDSSGDRGQFGCLLSERFPNFLCSYAYKKVLEQSVSPMWLRFNAEAKANGGAVPCNAIIDSGAFTAFTTGKIIDPREYAEWALDVRSTWQSSLNSLHFMNLDVIGDQDKSWQNQRTIERMGLQVLPIVTFNADKSHLIRAIEGYPYFALGGLVPLVNQKEKLRRWLNFCFSEIVGYKKKTGVMPRVHLLGITSEWVLQAYPCYSSDSSSWMSCFRFGGGGASGIKKVPKPTSSNAGLAANLYVVTSEIKRMKKMQDNATSLWKKRGIEWHD